MLWNKNYNSAILNLSDDLRKTIVDFSIAAFTSTLPFFYSSRRDEDDYKIKILQTRYYSSAYISYIL